MRKLIASLVLLSVVSSPVLASTVTRGNSNEISVFNDTKKDLAYVFYSGRAFNALYKIKAGTKDLYHSGYGDESCTINVAVPVGNAEPGSTTGYDPDSLQNCVNNARYNADLIRAVHINSPSSCLVTCLDGGSTSCLAKNQQVPRFR